ncbi:MAG: hypothetical protein MAGBODY4_00711 [Candidatus Marinimicrobia bacterium]|nr:hypothetical protein [Candidatus Neomarinimicrobiota bacterium]
MSIKLTSSAFEQGGMIPVKHTCDGEDVSPPLSWSGIPDSAESLALIADDPDAPGQTWVHWVLFNLLAEVTSLDENLSTEATLENGAIQGITDFGSHGYGGPCPPGGTHRYFFKIYALDTTLNLDSNTRKSDVVKAMDGHILAKGELVGKYSRQ